MGTKPDRNKWYAFPGVPAQNDPDSGVEAQCMHEPSLSNLILNLSAQGSGHIILRTLELTPRFSTLTLSSTSHHSTYSTHPTIISALNPWPQTVLFPLDLPLPGVHGLQLRRDNNLSRPPVQGSATIVRTHLSNIP